MATIAVGPAPRFLAVGEGGVWTLNQGDGSVSRIDPKTNEVVATIEVGVPGPGGEIAAGEGSVWVTSFEFPISRIDPKTNTVVQQFAGPGGDSIRVGLGSVWLCEPAGRQRLAPRPPPHRSHASRLSAQSSRLSRGHSASLPLPWLPFTPRARPGCTISWAWPSNGAASTRGRPRPFAMP